MPAGAGTDAAGRSRPGFRLTLLLAGSLWLILPAASIAQPAAETSVSRVLSELHDLVNTHRRSAGCEALRWHDATAVVAELHSKDMSLRNYFDHLTPEGTDVYRRLITGDVRWRGSIAENIALTAQGPEVVVELWMDSPPHRANIENCVFTHHGLGLYRDHWTQVLVERPRS